MSGDYGMIQRGRNKALKKARGTSQQGPAKQKLKPPAPATNLELWVQLVLAL